MMRIAHRSAGSGGLRDDAGISAVEAVIVAPLMFALLMLLIGGFRLAQADLQVKDAAKVAARAASLQRNTAVSAADGRAAAERSLGAKGLTCASIDVEVDVSTYEPGGAVSATVRCRADLSDLTTIGFGASKTFVYTAVVPVTQYRSRT